RRDGERHRRASGTARLAVAAPARRRLRGGAALARRSRGVDQEALLAGAGGGGRHAVPDRAVRPLPPAPPGAPCPPPPPPLDAAAALSRSARPRRPGHHLRRAGGADARALPLAPRPDGDAAPGGLRRAGRVADVHLDDRLADAGLARSRLATRALSAAPGAAH